MSRTNTINYLGDTLLTPANLPELVSVFKHTPDGLTPGHLPALLVCLEPGVQNGFSIKGAGLIRDDYTIGVYVIISLLSESNRSLVEQYAAQWADAIGPLLATHLNLGGNVLLIGDGENLADDQLVVFNWAGTDYRAIQFLIRVSELFTAPTGTSL